MGSYHRHSIDLEQAAGFEPATRSLATTDSTAELCLHFTSVPGRTRTYIRFSAQLRRLSPILWTTETINEVPLERIELSLPV